MNGQHRDGIEHKDKASAVGVSEENRKRRNVCGCPEEEETTHTPSVMICQKYSQVCGYLKHCRKEMLFSSLVVGLVAFYPSHFFVLFYICQLSCVYVWIFIGFGT